MENWKFALSSIWGHKMRSFLTMLGIIIGVAAVVVIVALGDGMQSAVTKEFTEDQQYVQIYYSPTRDNTSDMNSVYLDGSTGAYTVDGGGLTEEQPKMQTTWLEEIKNIPGVENYYLTNITSAAISYRSKSADSVTITGVSQSYFDVRKTKILAGRQFTSIDYQNYSRIIMLDTKLAVKLFGSNKSALNQVVSVGDGAYRVIGVYEDPESGSSMYGATSGGNAIMTNSQLSAEFGIDEAANIYIYIPDVTQSSEIGKTAANKLTELAGLSEGEYRTFDLTSLLQDIQGAYGIMTLVIGAIAGISLLVGGIGVMNIMLVSVTERTREIGLRKALGATRVKILTQFLIESMVLTIIGGLFGIGLAYAITGILGALLANSGSMSSLVPTVSILTVVGSVMFSAFIGIFFGLLPANKASKLNPIEALRYE